MRLNVFLQTAGVGSRREAERMIEAGRIEVNDRPAKVTTPVEEGDKVTIDGRVISAATRTTPRLYMLHKPIDVLVTTFDKLGRKTVFDLPVFQSAAWKKQMPRVMNVGRLDVNSEGLLMMSSDGQLAQAMMSPDMALERVYRVRVRGSLTPGEIAKMAKGVTIDGVKYRSVKVTQERASKAANSWYQVVLTEGKNREIRKLMEYFGCVVNRLIRIQYGPFRLGTLTPGSVQEVRPKDVQALIEDLRQRGAKL